MAAAAMNTEEALTEVAPAVVSSMARSLGLGVRPKARDFLRDREVVTAFIFNCRRLHHHVKVVVENEGLGGHELRHSRGDQKIDGLEGWARSKVGNGAVVGGTENIPKSRRRIRQRKQQLHTWKLPTRR